MTLTSQDVYNQISVAVDSADNVYVVNRTDNLIRQISLVGTNWVMTPVAGSAWNSGFADGAGNAAQFNNPMGTAVDNNGNLFVADAGNNAIRKVSPVGTNWVVTTVVGSRVSIGNADGIGCEALLNIPKGVAVDGAGNVYVADTYNQVIRKVSPVGTNWVVTTPTMGGGFSTPTSLAIDKRWQPVCNRLRKSYTFKSKSGRNELGRDIPSVKQWHIIEWKHHWPDWSGGG